MIEWSKCAVFVVLTGYVFAFYGFNAVARCEMEQHSFQQRARTVVAELAATNGCGF